LNTVEIEEAITDLSEHEFDAKDFLYAFLEVFLNKAATIKRLRRNKAHPMCQTLEAVELLKNRFDDLEINVAPVKN